MKWLVLISILVVSCTSKNSIHKASSFEVTFYNNGDTLKEVSTSDTLIKRFGEVLDGNTETLPACSAIGQIDFYKNDELVETVGISGTTGECVHLFIGKRSWKMTYNIGMYLSELHYYLKKEDERNN